MKRALPPSIVAAIDRSTILGIRAGSRSDHRFTGYEGLSVLVIFTKPR